MGTELVKIFWTYKGPPNADGSATANTSHGNIHDPLNEISIDRLASTMSANMTNSRVVPAASLNNEYGSPIIGSFFGGQETGQGGIRRILDYSNGEIVLDSGLGTLGSIGDAFRIYPRERSVFPDVTDTEQRLGVTRYRCLYVFNDSGAAPLVPFFETERVDVPRNIELKIGTFNDNNGYLSVAQANRAFTDDELVFPEQLDSLNHATIGGFGGFRQAARKSGGNVVKVPTDFLGGRTWDSANVQPLWMQLIVHPDPNLQFFSRDTIHFNIVMQWTGGITPGLMRFPIFFNMDTRVANVQVDRDSQIVEGAGTRYTARVTDELGNGIPDLDVRFRSTAGPATLVPQSASSIIRTNESGVAIQVVTVPDSTEGQTQSVETEVVT